MKITRSKLREIIRETINEVENPCWEGYTQVGMKMKDGKQVPNCVPVSEANVISALKEGDTEYQKYFRKELEKTGKSSPADMTDAEKKAFFTQVDKGWSGKTESVNEEESDIKVGSKVTISAPWMKKSFNDVVARIWKHPEDGSLLYVLKKTQGIWSKPYISLTKPLKEEFKHFISVDTPTQIGSKPIATQIEKLAKSGVRSKDIGLKMKFVGNEKAAIDAFQKVKNQIYFKLDKNESVVETLSPEVAKHMVSIYKGFKMVEDDGVMVYDSPSNAKKASDFLNSKKIAASSDGKYVYIESIVKIKRKK